MRRQPPGDPADEDVGRDGHGGADRGDRPQPVGVEAAQGEDGQDSESTLRAGELADQCAQERRGDRDLQTRREVGQAGPQPDDDQRRRAPAAVDADEVEPRRGNGPQPDQEGHHCQVVDGERRQRDLRAVVEPEDQPQQGAQGDQRQAVDDEGEPQHHPLGPRQQRHDQRQRHGGEVAPEVAPERLAPGVGQRAAVDVVLRHDVEHHPGRRAEEVPVGEHDTREELPAGEHDQPGHGHREDVAAARPPPREPRQAQHGLRGVRRRGLDKPHASPAGTSVSTCRSTPTSSTRAWKPGECRW